MGIVVTGAISVYAGGMEPKALGGLLANNVRRLLAVRGWTQTELASRMDVTGGVVSRILSGDYPPTGATLATLAGLLEVAPHELLLPAAVAPKKPANGRRKK